MMVNHDGLIKINHNINWSYIQDCTYIILIICGSGSDKNYMLLNLIKHQRPDIGKIYLHTQRYLWVKVSIT